MFSQIYRFRRSIAGLAVLGMLTVAVVAGQANANLPLEAMGPGINIAESADLILDVGRLTRAESNPGILDAVFTLPTRIELNLDLVTEDSAFRAVTVITLRD